MPDDTPTRPAWPLLILLAAGFALAHTQSPLFFSNQNQYLLHGLADAGYGHLSHDWLANTKDPTPAFSFLNLWDGYPSFALYSGNNNAATITIALASGTNSPALWPRPLAAMWP